MKTQIVTLGLQYSPAQNYAFFESEHLGRFRFFPKGRRLGFTRGGASACIEFCLEGKAVLWGDTIAGNIRRYVERYFIPALRSQGIQYTYNVVEKTLHIGRGHIDFRSADNPENWEGFGYDVIILNEAGIILAGENGRYLYQNAVMPMMIDNPNSQLIAGGVPKGRNGLYYELYQRAIANTPGYHARTFSSYENPWISTAAIKSLEHDMRVVGGEALVEQEIYGKFLDANADELRVIPRAWIEAAQERWKLRPVPKMPPNVAALDVSRGGRDKCALALQYGEDYVGPIQTLPGHLATTGGAVAAWAMKYLAPSTMLAVDVIGVGASAFDYLRDSRHESTVTAFNGAAGVDKEIKDRTGTLTFANERAASYWALREALDPDNGATLCLPPDEELAEDLAAPGFEITTTGIRLEKKDRIAERLGRSPDKGDAVSMLRRKTAMRRGGFFIATLNQGGSV